MRRISSFITLVSVVCVALAVPVHAEEDAVRRLRARTNISALQQAGHGIRVVGEATFRGSDGKYDLAFDGEGRFVETYDGPLSLTTGFDGSTAWEVDWNTTPRVLDFGDREEALLATWLWTGQWLLEPDGLDSVRFDSDEERFDMTLGQLQGRVYVEDDLPVRVEYSGTLASWEATLSDYETFSGVELPSTVLAHSDRGDKISIHLNMSPSAQSTAFSPRSEAPSNWRFFDGRELVVEQTSSGHLLVRARVNNEPAGWFVFDTGAGATAVSQTLASEQQLLRIGRSSVGGAGGSVDAYIHKIGELSIGPVTLFDVGCVALDLTGLSNAWGVEISGVIGYDLLSRTIVEMTDTPPSIAIYDRDHYRLAEGSWQDLWLPNRNAAVEASFEGHDGIFKLDTGAAASTVIFHVPTVESFDLLAERETTSTFVAGVGGGLPARAGRIAFFEFGGRRFENVSVIFATVDKGAFADRYTAGNIGGGIWGAFTLVFDYAGRRIAYLGN